VVVVGTDDQIFGGSVDRVTGPTLDGLGFPPSGPDPPAEGDPVSYDDQRARWAALHADQDVIDRAQRTPARLRLGRPTTGAVERRDTRARSKLIIVGDEDVWAERGGIGGELLREASSVVGSVAAQPVGHSEDDVQRLYEVLSVLDIGEVELGITVHGHRADAVVRSPDGGSPRPVLLDTGPADGIHPGAHLRRGGCPGAHLRRMLDRVALLGDGAVRIPAWRLFDDPRWIAQRLTA
jgi:hypothetical protein